ncbi:c-type cytochrome [Gemmata sp. G18]|uniref:C-type cytochrome n=1 Tax=Gemmata palustris TaxID=2822762 RepID=A0ABS5C590_9BACT|nr:c-type cytochrome [Gemmata palustris]MBP3960807.1 c-type cytochrome [Gemmata palustris]
MTAVLLLLSASAAAPPAPVTDLKLPPGFTAKLYADNPVAPDTYTMTIDDAGRVLIAGRGYVRVLVDDDNDGCADRAVDLIDGLKDGPMGLLAEGDSLFVVGDGGLKRYRGYNGRDKLKGLPETILALKTAGEHDAHAVRRGPDGWLYLLCGNMAGVRKTTITDARSPVRDPIAGVLVRISPDFKSVEVVADGFRNPYSFDFNRDGEPFTYDSDNERCVGLPWYEPCQFYHIVPGGNYGWRAPQRAQTWRKPPYFPDVVPPVCTLGRGSPTGVACYLHSQFPKKYQGGFFLADWTFGRIHHVPLAANNSTYTGAPEVFAEAVGTSGFAPTALAVHPKTGELFVSIGGRGTRGGVYRITFDKGEAHPKPLPVAKRSLDYAKASAEQWLTAAEPNPRKPANTAEDLRKRRHALEMMARYREKMSWSDALIDAVKSNLASADPLMRAAAARAAVALAIPVGDVPNNAPPTAAQIAVALVTAPDEPVWAIKVALGVFDNTKATENELIAAMRIVHLAHGDLTAKDSVGTVWEGYTLRDEIPKELARQLRAGLTERVRKSTQQHVELETGRLFAILGGEFDPPARWATLDRIRKDSDPVDDFHYLIAAARTSSKFVSPRTDELATALLGLQQKVKSRGVPLDRHWPLRFDEILTRFGNNWHKLNEAVVDHGEFGRPEHAALVRPLKLDADDATRRFVLSAAKDRRYDWTPGVVEFLARVPRANVDRLLLDLWERPGLEDAVLRVLAHDPRDTDRPKFVVGLKALDPGLVRISADALAKLPTTDTKDVCVAAIRALRRFPDAKADAGTRAALFTFLQKHTRDKVESTEKAWAAWLVKQHPDAAKALDANDGFDATAWQKRAAGIVWTAGDAERGRAAFAKATCAACHDGGRAIGPSLLGITKRFSRDDLLTAILQPNKDVPPRYRPVRVTTTNDTSYTGIIVYEATDGVILQTGADTTVRIAGTDIASKKLVDVSLMPAGLLDKLTDAEIADLLAYLGTLAEPKPK